tara:strand:+ start:778 stop:2733 length:1956 start_codon:yes stop_codon:yes gene_type:complete
MAHYIIQTIAFQLFFLLIYDVFFKKETFFNWNRFYLIFTAILSIVLPFIKIESFKSVVPERYIVSLPEVILGQTASNTNAPILLDAVVIGNSISYWYMAFYFGVTIAAIIFLFKLIKIGVLIFKNPKTNLGKLTLVKLINSSAAFSFFRYVFLGEFLKDNEKEAILKHEIIHVKQLHSIDLLFFEVLRIIFWFNPLVYMYQNRITALHEFIADAEAVKHEGKTKYYQSLLSQVFDTQKISFINPFFKQSLIKKRIVMLQKSKSKQIHLLKYALLIPIVVGMLVYTSAEGQEKVNTEQNEILDLNQYSYTLKKGEKLIGEKKKIHEKYEAFLKANQDYVSWSRINHESNIISYSVHSIKEKVPLSFSRSEVRFPDGSGYITYFNFSKSVEEEITDVEVPFMAVDKVPIFPSCEGLIYNSDKRDCMSQNISRHVNINFNTKLATELGLKGKQRINVLFKIDKEGNITGIRARAPHPGLEEEAIRVIKTLPKMIPGEHKGEKVNVPYSLPIIFQVADEQKEEDLVPLNEVRIKNEVPLSKLDDIPNFESCDNSLSKSEKKACLDQGISTHIVEHFNTKLANKLGLTGRQRINVIFKIDEQGHIIGIRSRAAHPDLEAEAIRVIKLLPKMVPGKVDGKNVVVPYSLPIIFEVEKK